MWMVTEILYGVDLAEYVKRFNKNRLHPLVAALIVREICRALSEVHKLQIVHRDIKPENIMMLDSGHVKLMDFGIAKVHRANATQTGTFMGSPSYMSPEQIRGSDVDVRADIYSLAVLFYEIITGALPYLGQTTAEVINKIMVGRYTPPNLLTTDLPYTLNEIIVRGMQSHKEQRYQDIRQLVQALDQFLQSCGFHESRIELETFTLQRQAFEERLAKLKLPKTSQHRLDTHTNTLDPVGDRSIQTRFLPSQHGKPSTSRQPSVPPRSVSSEGALKEPSPTRSHPPSKREPHTSQVKAPGPTAILPNQTAEAMRVPDIHPPIPQPPPPVPVPHAPPSVQLPRHTVPPHSAVTGAMVSHRRRPAPRIFIREHVVTEGRRRRSSHSNFLLLGL
ncbi:MAG: serine/threonine protein kinase, partial [Oligoflexus sp.]